jgi:ArsR family transcriptional regulator
MQTVQISSPAKLARRFQALADPTRLDILRFLVKGEHCVCELQAHARAQQSRLSFHLKKLKDAGLIEDRREGRWSYYRIAPAAFTGLSEFLLEMADASTARVCCARSAA